MVSGSMRWAPSICTSPTVIAGAGGGTGTICAGRACRGCGCGRGRCCADAACGSSANANATSTRHRLPRRIKAAPPVATDAPEKCSVSVKPVSVALGDEVHEELDDSPMDEIVPRREQHEAQY